MDMKWISNKEIIAFFVILFILASFGIFEGLTFIRTLKVFGINLVEILVAKHISFLIVKSIMVSLSSIGIWVGKTNGKLLFGSILVLVASLLL